MIDNENKTPDNAEGFDGENYAPKAASDSAQTSESFDEPKDIYSDLNNAEPIATGDKKPEQSYQGYFSEGPVNGYAGNNFYTSAEFESSVKAEPVGNAQMPEPEEKRAEFNPYASPRQQGRFYTNDPGNVQNNQGYQFNQQGYYQQPSPMPPEKKSGKGKKLAAGIIAACVVIAVIVIAMGIGSGNGTPVVSTTENTTLSQTTAAPVVSTTTPSDMLEINSVFVADKVRPSVVGVMTYADGQLYGEGSGIIWAEDKQKQCTYVVTCAHVIEETGVTYGILLLDGTSLEAEMVAFDTRTDIGVLKVNKTGLPIAEIGDSSTLKVGEPIYAIGNPGGSEYFGSITDGIVSAIDRSVSATYTMTCIQHNAAINPGNSGGALVNTAGQIVGINSSKIASTEFEGMGFAVPTSIATTVVDALIQYKYVPNRPKLGIEYAPVSAYQLYSLVVSIKELPTDSLVIAGISPDSSLAHTKAQVGDLIIAVNGKDMDDSSVLLDLIETGAVGDTLTLTLCRIEQRTYKTSTFDVTITLVEDKGGTKQEETTTQRYDGDYYYGGADSFEDFFEDYFGFGW